MTRDALRPFYDEIYLSPHLDDAVLSSGGRIAQSVRRGRRVLIVTVTAGDPPPNRMLARFARMARRMRGVPRTFEAVRRAEDAAAAHVLGAECLHWPMLDCTFLRDRRTSERLYPTIADVFGPLHPADKGRDQELTTLIATLPAAHAMIAPLGIGDHIDHLLTRHAAEHAWRKALYFYEDYPYSKSVSLETLSEKTRACRAEICELSETELQSKISAIAEYRSQVGWIFGGPDAISEQVRAQAAKVGGERYWHKSERPNVSESSG